MIKFAENNVLAVVVTYNRLELLKECISALKEVEGKLDILVVDNASTDETPFYLEANNISNIRLLENTGGAGGFFHGINEAVIRGYEYIWVMDDDTVPQRDALSELLFAAKKMENQFGFLCSYVEWVDGTPCVMNIPEIMNIESADAIELAKIGIIRCKKASFVSMLIKRDVIQHVGLPIKEFFIWGDDTEYSTRLSKFKNSYFVPTSKVIHKMKSNAPTDIVTDEANRLSRYRFLYRNQTYMARQKGVKAYTLHVGYIFYQIIKIIKSNCRNKLKRIIIVLQGWIMGIRFKPQIQYCRNRDS